MNFIVIFNTNTNDTYSAPSPGVLIVFNLARKRTESRNASGSIGAEKTRRLPRRGPFVRSVLYVIQDGYQLVANVTILAAAYEPLPMIHCHIRFTGKYMQRSL